MTHPLKAAFLLAFPCVMAVCLSGQVPSRVILGGRAVVMVADAVYSFPAARPRVVSVAGTDQGLGSFLSLVDPSFASKTALDRQAGAETFAALKPDAVILKSYMKQTLGTQLETLGIRTLYLNLETVEDYYADLTSLGALFSSQSRASELISWYKARESAVAAGVATVPEKTRKRVLLVRVSFAKGEAFEVPPASWIQTDLARKAGLLPVWTDGIGGNAWVKVGFEQIAAWNPDAIVAISYAEDSAEIAGRMADDLRFKGLKCGASGAILGMPQDWYSWDQSDTRWALGLQWMAKTFYPEAFNSLDLKKETLDFYRTFYGIADKDAEREVMPRLKGDHGF